ncbi:hypothetical protein Tco_0719252 [Tanacetum coccineum]
MGMPTVRKVQGSWKEVQWRQPKEQMSRIKEQVILRTKNNFGRGPDLGPVSPKKTWGREDAEEVDYSSLNKVYAKDMYPFPEEGEELASLLGYPYKCFLQLPKEYSQIRIAEDDEEKTGFHTEEGVYYFTHMLKELKKLSSYTSKDDEEGLSRSKRMECENILERSSNKNQK